MLIFYFVAIFVVSQTLPVTAFINGKSDLAIMFEVPILLLFMYITYLSFFRRCPICGKRKITITDGYGSTRYVTDNGICRNCKSHVSIMYDREKSESTYYIKDKYGQSHSVEPIWKINKNQKGE